MIGQLVRSYDHSRMTDKLETDNPDRRKQFFSCTDDLETNDGFGVFVRDDLLLQ